jgi:endoglucanase
MPGRSRILELSIPCLAVAVIFAVFVASPRPATGAAGSPSTTSVSLDGLVGLLGSTSSMGVAIKPSETNAAQAAQPAMKSKNAKCSGPRGWLRTQGVWIVEAKQPSCKVRLAGVTWYGMQSTNWVLAGLNFQDYHIILKEIKNLGFNSIRIPLSDQLVKENPKLTISKRYLLAQSGLPAHLHPLQLLDRIVTTANSLGLMIILDNHFSEARPASQTVNNIAFGHASKSVSNNTIWDAGYSETQWIKDWVELAKRYKSDSNVIGFDLRNEPHTNYQHGQKHWNVHEYLTAGATWGACPTLCGKQAKLWNPSSDWVAAAEKAGDAVQAVNSHLLLFVEGVQLYPDPGQKRGVEAYWWGSILKGVASNPIHFTVPNQLVYSPHEWGPWKCCGLPNEFSKKTSPASIIKIFNQNWGYILTDPKVQAPIWLGEFNTCNSVQLHPKWGPRITYANHCVYNKPKGSQGQWFQILLQYLAKNPEIGWSYYPLNGTNAEDEASNNSVLDKTWSKPSLTALMNALKAIEKQPAE